MFRQEVVSKNYGVCVFDAQYYVVKQIEHTDELESILR
jgi:hypothetical protein